MTLLIAFLLSLNPGLWHLTYTGNATIPVVANGSEVYFDFPVQPDQPGSAYVNYLWSPFNSSLTNAQALRITLRIDTSGEPIFGYHSEAGNTCSYPAHVRFYFEARGWNKHPRDGDYRWWSNPTAYQLQSTAGSTVTLLVNLDGAQWSNVWGEFGNTRQRQFASAKKTVENIGLSFGGGCFFGHGVNVNNGTARFVLLGYEVL